MNGSIKDVTIYIIKEVYPLFNMICFIIKTNSTVKPPIIREGKSQAGCFASHWSVLIHRLSRPRIKSVVKF